MKCFTPAFFILLIFSLFFSLSSHAAMKLPSLNIDIQSTSVSGLSSGAFMTSQFYLVHSDIMVGAGIIAGGPYLCAKSWSFNSNLENAMTACMSPLTSKYGPNVPHLVDLTYQLSEADHIDDVKNIQDDRLYIFTGKADRTVYSDVVEQTQNFFLALNVPKTAIMYDNKVDAGHAIITNSNQNTKCSLTKSPYINDCDFMQSGKILNHIYDNLKPPSNSSRSNLIEFDQSEFIEGKYTSMSKNAYAYIPKACHSQQCRTHVVFHGCEQGAKVIGDAYYWTTGYNNIAEANNLVMLYPQVQPSNKKKPFNPKGCWDFWGYSIPNASNPDFFSKNAPQIKAVRAMIDRLSSK